MPDDPTPVAPPAGIPGSTPAPGGPPTTPSAPPAGDDNNEPMTLAEARKLRREAQDLRARIKQIDDEKAAAELAKLGDIERLTKQHAALEEQMETLASELYEARVRDAVADLVGKFNFVPSAKTVATLLLADEDAIEFEDGHPTNIEKLLEKLAKAEPDLVKAAPATPGQPQMRQAPTTPAWNPGRSSVSPPGGSIPGRIPRLEDIEWKR